MSFEISVIKLNCPECHVPFWITGAHETQLRSSGKSFYCPSGHSQYFSKKPDQTAAELAAVKERNKVLQDEVERLLRDKRKKQCPKCSARVLDLKRHMKRKH